MFHTLFTFQERTAANTLIKVGAAALFAALLLTTAGWYMAGRSVVGGMYEGRGLTFFIVPPHVKSAHTPEELFLWMGKALMLTTALAGTVCVFAMCASFWNRRDTAGRRASLIGLCASIGLCAFVLLCCGYNSKWYPVEKAMTFTADPPYVHRVLFVLVAKLLQWTTGLADMKCFFVSQIAALILAMVAVQKWAELFVRKEAAFLAPVLAALMLAPTITYFTFYDIGIVFFYAAGLTLLFQRRAGWYLVLIGAGTLNHENILFLIILSAVVSAGYYSRRNWLAFVLGQIAIYAGVRAVLFSMIPVSRAWAQGNVWINVEYILYKRFDLAETAVLFLWFATAVYFGITSAPAKLRRCMILLPILVAMTALVGQLNEARQFDAFIPVAVVLFLRGVYHRRSEPQDSLAAVFPRARREWTPDGTMLRN